MSRLTAVPVTPPPPLGGADLWAGRLPPPPPLGSRGLGSLVFSHGASLMLSRVTVGGVLTSGPGPNLPECSGSTNTWLKASIISKHHERFGQIAVESGKVGAAQTASSFPPRTFICLDQWLALPLPPPLSSGERWLSAGEGTQRRCDVSVVRRGTWRT